MGKKVVERIITPPVVFSEFPENLRKLISEYVRMVSDLNDIQEVFKPARKEALVLLILILSNGSKKVRIQRVYVNKIWFNGSKTSLKFYRVPEYSYFKDLLFLLIYDKKLFVAKINDVERFIVQNEWEETQ